MIKINTEEGGGVEIKGFVPEIISETIGAVRAIYTMIKEDDPFGAKMYKDMILKEMYVAFKTPEEIKELNEKSLNEMKDKLGHFSEMLDFLEKLIHNEENNKEKDIRSADFESDVDFKKWFNGEDNK